jgi:hypothetical protein
MLQIKLAALVADTGRERKMHISIESLLHPGWSYVAVDAHLAERNAVFRAQVSLPEVMELKVGKITLPYRLNAEDPVRFFETLNAIDLTSCRFKILRGAAGDCFDVGLLFIDARTGDVCLWLGDNTSAAEDSSPPTELRASLPDTFNSGKKETAVQTGLAKIRASLKGSPTTKTKTCEEGEAAGEGQENGGNHLQISPAGRALTEGRVLFAYLSTHQGRGKFTAGDSTRCDVTVVGRDVVEHFLTPTFFPFYALFRSAAGPAARQVRGKRAGGEDQ